MYKALCEILAKAIFQLFVDTTAFISAPDWPKRLSKCKNLLYMPFNFTFTCQTVPGFARLKGKHMINWHISSSKYQGSRYTSLEVLLLGTNLKKQQPANEIIRQQLSGL